MLIAPFKSDSTGLWDTFKNVWGVLIFLLRLQHHVYFTCARRITSQATIGVAHTFYYEGAFSRTKRCCDPHSPSSLFPAYSTMSFSVNSISHIECHSSVDRLCASRCLSDLLHLLVYGYTAMASSSPPLALHHLGLLPGSFTRIEDRGATPYALRHG
jgi:hypothetical protein